MKTNFIPELNNKFPDEWILIDDPVTDENLTVESGKLLWHSKNRDEIYRVAREKKPDKCAIIFTGKIPQGCEIIL